MEEQQQQSQWRRKKRLIKKNSTCYYKRPRRSSPTHCIPVWPRCLQTVLSLSVSLFDWFELLTHCWRNSTSQTPALLQSGWLHYRLVDVLVFPVPILCHVVRIILHQVDISIYDALILQGCNVWCRSVFHPPAVGMLLQVCFSTLLVEPRSDNNLPRLP